MTSAIVVVTGANGLVGSHVVSALGERGATVRAVVRRVGTAPQHPAVEEHVGDFADPVFAATVVAGADALVTTVHPLGSGRDDQRRVGFDGTLAIAEAAVDAGVPLLVHVSTAGVYDRSPEVGDVDVALARMQGTTRVLLRPPAILGPGATSVWNTVRPAQMRDDEGERHANPDQTFAWVHVDDLATIAADLATGAIATAADPEAGPVAGGCTPVNVASGPATQRDYLGAVTEALGVEPTWEEGPAWTGQILAERAQRWGWAPRVDLTTALEELKSGLKG